MAFEAPISSLPAHVVARLTDDDILLTRAEAAVFLTCSVPTIERWHANGEGPPQCRIGGRCRYRLSELKQWRDGKRAAA
jgi:excisionase family DNA binding protein